MTSDAAADDPQLSRQGSPLAADACAAQKKTNENNRRSNKPIMEKKRRARINNCLNELKTLILDATKKDPARHSKLEKADILEMTVKHLESMQRHGVALSAATESTVANKFKAGFDECSNEVNRFPGLEPHVRKRLMQHLGAYFNKDVSGPRVLSTSPETTTTTTATSHLRLHLHDSGRNAVLLSAAAAAGSARGVQLVPTRLANGDIALVLPSSGAAETTTPPSPAAAIRLAAPPSDSSSGTESPAPDRPSSCCSSGSSCADSAADAAYGLRSESPLALVTKRRRDDEHSDLERPWRPW